MPLKCRKVVLQRVNMLGRLCPKRHKVFLSSDLSVSKGVEFLTRLRSFPTRKPYRGEQHTSNLRQLLLPDLNT